MKKAKMKIQSVTFFLSSHVSSIAQHKKMFPERAMYCYLRARPTRAVPPLSLPLSHGRARVTAFYSPVCVYSIKEPCRGTTMTHRLYCPWTTRGPNQSRRQSPADTPIPTASIHGFQVAAINLGRNNPYSIWFQGVLSHPAVHSSLRVELTIQPRLVGVRPPASPPPP